MELRPYQSVVIDATLNWIKYFPEKNGYITAPGGSGKSVMISRIAQECYDMGKRVIILARNEKLLTQNRAKFEPFYDPHIGIYCAGLGEKDASKPITVASIQSMINCHDAEANIVLVDEAHNVHQDPESETQYWGLFRRLGNPQIIGLTATSFRTGSGKLQWGDEIINIPIQPLIDDKHIVPPINKVANTPDLSGVTIKMGEYVESQLEDIFLDPALLTASVRKIAEYSTRANSVLIFTQSRKHSAVLRDVMLQNGMPSITVDGEMLKPELRQILQDFENFQFKYLINCNLLKEGYDAPQIDMVVLLRSTISKGSFEQMVYRGTRLYPGKENFLLLDMGGNLMEHGALGSPYAAPAKGEPKKSKGKICPTCETMVKPTDRQCPDCGYEWPPAETKAISHDYDNDADSRTVYAGALETYKVTDVIYRSHRSKAGNMTLRIDYMCNTKYGAISEWMSPHHENEWARNKVSKLFADRGNPRYGDIKEYSMDDLIFHAQKLRKPVEITVNHAEKFPRILTYKFADDVEKEPFVLDDEIIW